MQFKFDVLGAGDKVIAAWDGHFAVRHPSKEVEIYNYSVDEDGYPHLGDHTILIQHGVKVSKEQQLEALDILSHLLTKEDIEELEKHPIERIHFREKVDA